LEIFMISNSAQKKISLGFLAASTFALCLLNPFPKIHAAPPQQDAASLPTLDYEFFKTRVEPIFLERRSPEHARCYVCHEIAKHHSGLNLESLLPGNTFWTEEQSRRNFQTVSKLVDPGHPDSSIFPMHPLAPEAGGDIHAHGGGRQFTSQNDPDFQTVVEWIRGQKASGASGQ
jgi:hypothetical protein